MEDLHQKVAYLQGLMAGLDLQQDSREGKILVEMVGVMNEVADHIAELRATQEELEDQLEDLEENLTDLEEEVFDDSTDWMEVECPNCHEVVCFDSDIAESDDLIEVTCPNCDAVVFVNDDEALELTEDTDHGQMRVIPGGAAADDEDI